MRGFRIPLGRGFTALYIGDGLGGGIESVGVSPHPDKVECRRIMSCGFVCSGDPLNLHSCDRVLFEIFTNIEKLGSCEVEPIDIGQNCCGLLPTESNELFEGWGLGVSWGVLDVLHEGAFCLAIVRS